MRASYRTDLVTSLLSIWFMVGLMLDAWAHNNIPDLESFFTPWHAVFYTGFVAVGAWIAWSARAGLRNGRWEPAAMPRAYPASVVALAGFAVFAVSDYTWHTVFGIEQNINILFSPTHLGLAATMMVIVTTPLRSYWADAPAGTLRAVPAMLSIALAATLVLLFLQYSNVLVYQPDGVVFALGSGRGATSEFVSALAMTNLVIVLPVLVLARRTRLPIGATTLVCVLAAGLSMAITGANNVSMNLTLIGAGVVIDVLAGVLRPITPARYLAFGFLFPLLLWAIYLGTANGLSHAQIVPEPGQRPESAVELWTGAPIVQGLLGLLLACVLRAMPEVGAGTPAPEPVRRVAGASRYGAESSQ
jgi:hypothetical protein